MASRSLWMNGEEALQEILADRDSDLSEESNLDSEWDVSESSESNSETEDENESRK